ncbi:MAG: DUF3309 family protein [Bradyrhizobium sp.]
MVILALLGPLPTWPHGSGQGFCPSGGGGLTVVMLLVLLLMGRIEGRLWRKGEMFVLNEESETYTILKRRKRQWLSILESELKQRIGWVDEAVSPFARGTVSRRSLATHASAPAAARMTEDATHASRCMISAA